MPVTFLFLIRIRSEKQQSIVTSITRPRHHHLVLLGLLISKSNVFIVSI